MDLEQAIKAQSLEDVIDIITRDNSSIEGETKDGLPLFMYAAKLGNFPIVKYIVEYSRASMNTVDDENRNILHYAAMSGNVELNRYLVEKVGMDITSADINLITPYQIAWEMGHKELLAYYEKRVGAAYEDMYHNPIRTGTFPDPSIVRVGDDYYMVNSSFIYFPCIPVSHSKDLVNWDIIGYAITNPRWAMLDELEGGRGYWAPDISYDNGTFYITATYRLNDTGTVYRRQIVVSSDKPEGPYSEPAIIDEDGIDPSIFHENGRHYMLLNRGARIFELSSDCKRKLTEPVMLYYGDHKRAPEGPHLIKKDGYYYLILAEGGTGPGHRVTVARSRELMGNYEPCPYNPIMTQTDPKAAIQRCGHGKLVCTQNGEWYMVYLCGRKLEGKYSILGRETALDPVTWTADGWPIVNNLNGPSVLQIRPNLPKAPQKPVPQLAQKSVQKSAPKSVPKLDQKSVTKAVDSFGISDAAMSQSNMTQVSDKNGENKGETSLGDGQPEGYMTNVSLNGDFLQGMLTNKVKKHEYTFYDGLPKDFITPRPPEEGAISFRDGRLILKGSSEPLSSVKARNILVRRQCDFCFKAEAAFEVPELDEGQEAGITCYYDENTWVCFFFSREEREDGRYFLQVREHIGQTDICHDKEYVDKPAGENYMLGVETEYLNRRFYYARAGKDAQSSEAALISADGAAGLEEKTAAKLSNVYYLCDEGISFGKRFTGAMVGMYGYAGAKPLYVEFIRFIYYKL